LSEIMEFLSCVHRSSCLLLLSPRELFLARTEHIPECPPCSTIEFTPVFGWERPEEIPITNWRDHGQLSTSVQKHDQSFLRSINRPASREDAAILTIRHWGLVGSGVFSISASSSSQMSSRTLPLPIRAGR